MCFGRFWAFDDSERVILKNLGFLLEIKEKSLQHTSKHKNNNKYQENLKKRIEMRLSFKVFPFNSRKMPKTIKKMF